MTRNQLTALITTNLTTGGTDLITPQDVKDIFTQLVTSLFLHADVDGQLQPNTLFLDTANALQLSGTTLSIGNPSVDVLVAGTLPDSNDKSARVASTQFVQNLLGVKADISYVNSELAKIDSDSVYIKESETRLVLSVPDEENRIDGGEFNTVLTGRQNFITGGKYNTICGGYKNIIDGEANSATILNGTSNTIYAGLRSAIYQGTGCSIGSDNPSDGSIGADNSIQGGRQNAILAGSLNTITNGTGNIINGGESNNNNILNSQKCTITNGSSITLINCSNKQCSNDDSNKTFINNLEVTGLS